MNRKISAHVGKALPNLYGQIGKLINQGNLDTVAGTENFAEAQGLLTSIFGGESANYSISADAAKVLGGGTKAQLAALTDSIHHLGNSTGSLPNLPESLIQFAGTEGFSQANYQGSQTKVRGASIVLNALAHRQTPAAEALYPTVTIPYQDEQLEFTVRSSGLGRYVYGGSAYDRASELRPVMSLLREGEIFMDDTLQLVPVYPTDPTDKSIKLFMDKAIKAPVEQSYGPADALGRETHLTQYLKVPSRIPNFLGLCAAPGALPFDNSDEVESNSLKVKSIALSATIGATGATAAAYYLLDTTSFSQASFGLAGMAHSSDDRQLNLRVQGLASSALTKTDGTPADFSKLTPVGGTVYFALNVTGNFQRQTNTLDINGGAFEIDYIVDANGVRHNADTDNATIAALFAQFDEGKIEGIWPHANHSNTNRNNFGYRVEVFDVKKVLSIRRQTPISVRYPVAKEDTNEESLNFAINEMAVIVNAQTTTAAFVAAAAHFDYVSSISGSAIVGNEQGSNTLAGMHYTNATAVHRAKKLQDLVSTENSVDTYNNISAAIVNNLTEMAAALATNSNLAAIAEYNRQPIKWVIVAHQNLGRYIMRSGDARTLAGYQDFEVELTNMETMIGKFYIVPKSVTDGDVIDPLGAIGVCVSKEHVVVTGQVTRNNRDFGTVITQTSFSHNSICPIIGLLEFTDAATALTEEGLINNVTAQRIYLAGSAIALYEGDNPATNKQDAGILP